MKAHLCKRILKQRKMEIGKVHGSDVYSIEMMSNTKKIGRVTRGTLHINLPFNTHLQSINF